jgi:hypothetical protein
MIKDIRERIKAMVDEGLELAFRTIEISNEGVEVHVSMPHSFSHAKVVVEGMKRPFQWSKLQDIVRILHGNWRKKLTKQKFAKMESLRHSNPVSLTMRFYFAECLDEKARGEIQVLKGRRGRVLTPELCNGDEMRMLNTIDSKET